MVDVWLMVAALIMWTVLELVAVFGMVAVLRMWAVL